MKQAEINEAEWRNPANWSNRGRLGIYASKSDTRLLVPKATPVMGWTVNFAHHAWAYVLFVIVLLPILLAIAKQML